MLTISCVLFVNTIHETIVSTNAIATIYKTEPGIKLHSFI